MCVGARAGRTRATVRASDDSFFTPRAESRTRDGDARRRAVIFTRVLCVDAYVVRLLYIQYTFRYSPIRYVPPYAHADNALFNRFAPFAITSGTNPFEPRVHASTAPLGFIDTTVYPHVVIVSRRLRSTTTTHGSVDTENPRNAAFVASTRRARASLPSVSIAGRKKLEPCAPRHAHEFDASQLTATTSTRADSASANARSVGANLRHAPHESLMKNRSVKSCVVAAGAPSAVTRESDSMEDTARATPSPRRVPD